MASSISNAADPSMLNIANFVTIKLSSDSSHYLLWKVQMLCLLGSQDLVGFIDGTIQPPSEKVPINDYDDINLVANKDYLKWKRSDQLIKGWILGSLTEEMLQKVAENTGDVWLETKCCAADVWLELKNICCPTPPQEVHIVTEVPAQPDIVDSMKGYNYYLPLYEALLCVNWEAAKAFLNTDEEASSAHITSFLQTPLHVAVAVNNTNTESFIKHLVDTMANDALAVKDCFGEMPLHCAARLNNLDAAKILVTKNTDLPHVASNNGLYPIHLAVEYCHKSTGLVRYFFDLLVNDNAALNKDDVGVRLLCRLIRSDLYDLAKELIEKIAVEKLNSKELSPLALLATKTPLSDNEMTTMVFLRYLLHKMKRELKAMNEVTLAEHLCEKLKQSTLNGEEINNIISGPLLVAASLDNYKLVEIIVRKFPLSIGCRRKDRKNIMHIAVENCCKKVFRLIYQMRQHRHYLMISVDFSNNTILHLAGKLSPQNNLNHLSGAAIQMTQELRWFEEVKKHLPPCYYENINDEGKTAHQVFTEEHAKLKKDGDKWLNDTANSCSLVAALVVTIAFTAAITVPGGNNSENGLPIFIKSRNFCIFAFLNAMSLCTSTTSLISFLSLLSSRKSEKDFLLLLPSRLYAGLYSLLLSILLMLGSLFQCCILCSSITTESLLFCWLL